MYAGQASVEHGHPNDGLKMLQCGQVKAWAIPPDHDRRTVVEACVLVECAMALASLEDPKAAYRDLAKGRDLWQPKPTDRTGDLDIDAALLDINRGRLDTAEQFAAASVQRWEGISQRARTRSGIVLATIHLTAGEPHGLQLAHTAITDTTKLTSVRVRRQLLPLVQALETRPGRDYQNLARMARQVAA